MVMTHFTKEIDESWRHHDLLKRKRPYDRMSNSFEDIVEEERPLSNRTDHDNDYEASRQEWSRKKVKFTRIMRYLF